MDDQELYLRAAAQFVAATQADEWSDEDIERVEKMPLAQSLATALQAAGFGPPVDGPALGRGSFGVAFELRDRPDLVLKITTDPTEITVGSFLLGKRLAHVAQVHGAWKIKGSDGRALTITARRVKVTPSDNIEEYEEIAPIGVLVVERLERDPDTRSEIGDSRLSETVHDVKRKFGLYPSDLTRLSRAGARRRLEQGAVELSKRLYSRHNEVCSDVASGIEELYEIGVFAVDVHGGNVGRDPESFVYKIFDVGTASSPARVKVKTLDTRRAPLAASEAYAAAACEDVGVSVIVLPSAAPSPERLIAAKGESKHAQHTHPVVAAEGPDLSYLLGPRGGVRAIGHEDGPEPPSNGLARYRSEHGSYRYVYYVNGAPMSALQVITRDKKHGRVANVWTAPQARRCGYATLLLQQARRDFKTVAHSDDLSADAKAWISHVGEAGDRSAMGEPIASERGASEKVQVAYEASIPWVKLERDPAKYKAQLKEADKAGPIEGPKQVWELVHGYMEKQDQEVFLVVLVDIHRKLRGVCEVARGQRARVTVAVADIMRPVLESGAAAFVVVHNHPSGKAKPSDADKELTRAIKEGAKTFGPDVKFLDHVIVGMGEYYSFDERKLYSSKA